MDYNNEMKFKQSKRTIQNMNETIPAIDVIGGIRAFGPSPYSANEKNPLMYGMNKYSKQDFATAINSVSMTGGGTRLANVISYAATDLGKTDGKIALIIITEWPVFRQPEFELMTKKLKQKVIFDGRNLYPTKQMEEMGFKYISIGRKEVNV